MKKYAAVILGAAMVLSLAACGAEQPGNLPESSQSGTQSQTSSKASTPAVPKQVSTRQIDWAQIPEAPASDFEFVQGNDGVFVRKYLGKGGDVKIPSVFEGRDVLSVNADAFSGCGDLTAVKVPDSVTGLGDRAFYECKKLDTVDLGNSITHIGISVFKGCESLTSISIPDSTVEIKGSVFSDTGLVELKLGSGLRKATKHMVEDAPSLAKIEVSPESQYFSSEDGVLFSKDKTTLVAYPDGKPGSHYVIPSTVTTLGELAFKNSSLKTVEIPNSVTKAEDQAFAFCGLEEVTIPGSLEVLSKEMFLSSTNLKKAVCEEGVETIGTSAFRGCKQLESVVLPQSLKVLGNMSFNQCTALKQVTIPDTVKRIQKCFEDCKNLSATYQGKTYTHENRRELYND